MTKIRLIGMLADEQILICLQLDELRELKSVVDALVEAAEKGQDGYVVDGGTAAAEVAKIAGWSCALRDELAALGYKADRAPFSR